MKLRGWKMIFNAKEHKKKVVVVNLISDKIDYNKGIYNDKGINTRRGYNTN